MRKSRLLYGDRPIGIALRPHLLDRKQFRALTLSAERFVVWETILFEAKAVEKLTDSHIKQALEDLAARDSASVYWLISAAMRWNGNGGFYSHEREEQTLITGINAKVLQKPR